MGLKISTIVAIPENVERSYYLYILDYYNWEEPISKTLRDSFDKISKFAVENDSVVILGRLVMIDTKDRRLGTNQIYLNTDKLNKGLYYLKV